jgi:hypothetical protein
MAQDSRIPVPEQPQSGRTRHEAEVGDGLLIRNKATGEVARYSTQIALAEIERGNAELIEE